MIKLYLSRFVHKWNDDVSIKFELDYPKIKVR